MPKIYKTWRFIWANGVWGNSVSVLDWDFVTKTGWFMVKTTAGASIEWVASGEQTFASNNQTVAKAKLEYQKKDDYSQYLLDVAQATITFSGALVTSNVINLKVNWVSMTPVTYASSDANTLWLIATQLTTDFPTLIASATAGTNKVIVVPVLWNDSIAITDVVVTLGAGQATATVTEQSIVQADEWKYADILTWSQRLDYNTLSTSTWQVKIEKVLSGNRVAVSIANL